MIKAIFFDFDGTLCDLVDAHYYTLNQAIEQIAGKDYVITKEEQDAFFNGLSTKVKLNKLKELKSLPNELIGPISSRKQELTLDYIHNFIEPVEKIKDTLSKLKKEYILYCVSNALSATVKLSLTKMDILDLFDKVIGNEEVERQKPYPDIYLKAFLDAKVSPHEVLILEDSKHGREAAYLSGAQVCTLDNPNDIDYNYIKSQMNKEKKIPWIDTKLTVLIPMSGAGSRFAEVGYTKPKPLIDIDGLPMIKRVIDNLNIKADYVFIVQHEHCSKFNIDTYLKSIVPNCKIVVASGLTEGAACSVLLAKDLINNDKHLLIANSDQLVDWNSSEFMSKMLTSQCDGGLLTFTDLERNPKWSFAKVENGKVIEVAEKNPISENASVGIYYYNKGSEFVKYAEQMISKNIRTRNEFYLCPVYNEYIGDNKKIIIHAAKEMVGIGTPEDKNLFDLKYKNKEHDLY